MGHRTTGHGSGLPADRHSASGRRGARHRHVLARTARKPFGAQCRNKPNSKPRGMEAATISFRLGALGVSGIAAGLMMRLSARGDIVLVLGLAQAGGREPRTCARVGGGVRIPAPAAAPGPWFWAGRDMHLRAPWLALQRTPGAPWPPSGHCSRCRRCGTLQGDLAGRGRTRLFFRPPAVLGCSGPKVVASWPSLRMRSASWVRNCTISGEATTWLTSAVLARRGSQGMDAVHRWPAVSARSERACTISVLMPTSCWSTSEVPGAVSVRPCCAL